MKNKTLLKIIFIFFIATVLFCIGKTIYDCIVLLNCDYCSAPWYAALLLDIVIFFIPITVELILLFYLKKKIKKQN